MNILLIIASVIAGIIVLVLLIAAISKKEYSVKRDIVIKAHTPTVFDYVKHIKTRIISING